MQNSHPISIIQNQLIILRTFVQYIIYCYKKTYIIYCYKKTSNIFYITIDNTKPLPQLILMRSAINASFYLAKCWQCVWCHDTDVVAANLRHGCRMFACHIHVSTCLSRKACIACIKIKCRSGCICVYVYMQSYTIFISIPYNASAPLRKSAEE